VRELSGWADVLPLVGLLAVTVLLWRLRPPPPLPSASSDVKRPTCAVIVPARNESLSLATVLDSVKGQLRAGDELLVVDDHSTDDTSAIAHRCGARVIVPDALPDGWLGKPWACWTGARQTASEVVVFVDADVCFGAGGLDRIVGAVGADVASIQPFHQMATAVERVSLFGNLTSMIGAAACGPWAPHSATNMAFGPVIAMSRSRYEACGGHEAVRNQLVEDIALARAVGSSRCYAGREVVSFRMYPEGWRQVMAGWVRNLRPGLGASPWWMTLIIAAWMAALLGGPFAWWGWYVVGVAQVWWAARRVGSYGIVAAVGYPVLGLVFVVLAVWSLTSRSVSWRGRTVERSTGPRP
jgi:4,4'-diaponeurosporenoate glycosyltransferase